MNPEFVPHSLRHMPLRRRHGQYKHRQGPCDTACVAKLRQQHCTQSSYLQGSSPEEPVFAIVWLASLEGPRPKRVLKRILSSCCLGSYCKGVIFTTVVLHACGWIGVLLWPLYLRLCSAAQSHTSVLSGRARPAVGRGSPALNLEPPTHSASFLES